MKRSFKTDTAVLARFCIDLAVGTVAALLLHFLLPIVHPTFEGFLLYVNRFHSPYSAPMALVTVCALVLAALLAFGRRAGRSLRLGLLRAPNATTIILTFGAWTTLDSGHSRIGVAVILVGIAGAWIVSRYVPAFGAAEAPNGSESDRPVPEYGRDLLGRKPIIEALLQRILFEQPAVIAVTAPYGDGKTSFLNLAIGELKKVIDLEQPIVINFSPWLAADSNALVASLLGSVVTEMSKSYLLPGLKRDAYQYASVLLSIIPKTERFGKTFLQRTQQEQIDSLARRISQTGRRVLIVLDDLDRLEARELETVLKLLRGSEALANCTFLCSFDDMELKRILEAERPKQDIGKFLEKFFQITVPLPKIDPEQLRKFFSERIGFALSRYQLRVDDLSKITEDLWANGGSQRFTNLRRIKLFVNKIDHSLLRIGDEVNLADFIALELIRDAAPELYEQIYLNSDYFWNADFAFEVAYRGRQTLDASRAKKERAAFYDKFRERIPSDCEYIIQLLEQIFPHFAEYMGKWGAKSMDPSKAERQKRLCHPRYFRQYFLLKVPSELYSEKDFRSFIASIKKSTEAEVIYKFNEVFESLLAEDFKRWHFVDKVEGVFAELSQPAKRGLCRAFAQKSRIWTTDAFELFSAFRCTREELRILSPSGRLDLLSDIVAETSSFLYAMCLLDLLKEDAPELVPANPQALHELLKKRIRERYLSEPIPNIFDEYPPALQKIEAVQFLFSWRNLGADAAADEQSYLESLLSSNTTALDSFLKSLFRVDLLDDYENLKPLIDYTKLATIVERHAHALNGENVDKFRRRRAAENPTDSATIVSRPQR